MDDKRLDLILKKPKTKDQQDLEQLERYVKRCQMIYDHANEKYTEAILALKGAQRELKKHPLYVEKEEG